MTTTELSGSFQRLKKINNHNPTCMQVGETNTRIPILTYASHKDGSNSKTNGACSFLQQQHRLSHGNNSHH